MFRRKRANNSVSTGIIILFLSPRLPRLALFGTKLEPAPLKNTCYAIYFSKTQLIFNIRSRKINTYNIVIVKLHIREMNDSSFSKTSNFVHGVSSTKEPGARFSKVPKAFRALGPVSRKSRNFSGAFRVT